MDLYSSYTLISVGAFITTIIVIYLIGTWPYNEFKKRKLPFRKPQFFVGNMGPYTFGKLSLGDQSLSIYREFSGHRAVGFFNFLKPRVYVRDPDVIKMITVKDFDYFTDHQSLVIDEEDDVLFGKFIFSMKGKRWKAMRNLLSPAFTSSKMKSMFVLVEECGKQLTEYLEQKCKHDKDGIYIAEMSDLFSRYANDVIAATAYGIKCDSLQQPNNEFFTIGKVAVDFSGVRALILMTYASVKTLMKLFRIRVTPKYVTDFFISIVAETLRVREKENIVRQDMIQLLMQARKGTLRGDDDEGKSQDEQTKKTNVAVELTDADIAAQAFIFFVAGYDTSSALMTFLAYELAIHPDIQDRVQQEIDEILKANNGRLTYDGIMKMRYLDNVISETSRLWPTMSDIDRECVRDYTVPATETQPEIVFKKGDGVLLAAYGMHLDPEYFPEPERFDPERFSDENKHTINPFSYLPFGAGPRNCIGMRFALMETKIAIASILSRFNFCVTAKTTIPAKLAPSTFFLRPEGGVWLAMKPRVY